MADRTYEYQALPESHIRLLRIIPATDGPIHCSMTTAHLATSPSYAALSYTWGAPCAPNTTIPPLPAVDCVIHLDGRVKPVTENLHRAMLRLRETSEEQYDQPIWIDAICINQEDNAEKAVQVQAMDHIYKSARVVVAWLGEWDNTVAGAILVMKCLARIPQTDYSTHATRLLSDLGVPGVLWLCFITFFRRTWFNRAWVFQEAALAPRLLMVCGNQIIPDDVVRPAVAYLCQAGLWAKLIQYASIIAGEGRDIPALGGILSVFAGDLVEGIASGGIPYQLLLPLSRGLEAGNPKDHIYSMYGLIKYAINQQSPHVQLPDVDYNLSVEDIYLKWAQWFIGDGTDGENYYIFSMVEDRSHRRLQGLPSWVPDQSISMYPAILRHIDVHRLWQPCGNTAPGKIDWTPGSRLVTTQAALFDSVVRVSATLDDGPTHEAWLTVLDIAARLRGVAVIETIGRTLLAGQSLTKDHFITTFGSSMSLLCAVWAVSGLAMEPDLVSSAAIATRASLMGNGNENLVERFDTLLRESVDHRREITAEFDNRNDLVRKGRRLFATSKGSAGIVALSVSEDDEVWIMPGSPTPFVLRKRDDGTYELVGEAYVDGIMNGEAFRNDSSTLKYVEVAIV
ncbi:hypothetical protein LTR27_012495 [Elasticomyces elasticus]|nr:hypothetical protein LTR27_012495 [Elasticomyces elasticus]